MEKILQNNDDPLKISIDSYEKSDVILAIFFSIVDIFILLFIFFYIKSKEQKVLDLKNKLVKFIVIDYILRLLYTKKYSSWSFFKEFFFTFMNMVQFYLLITFISLAANPKNKEKSDFTIFYLCMLFFLITFSYEYIYFLGSPKLLNLIIKKFILLIQYLSALYYIYKSYEEFKKMNEEIGNALKGKIEKDDKLNLLIIGSPQSCFILFYLNYIIKFLNILVNNPVYLIYINIILNIFKEACKYFAFFICQLILYQINKIKIMEEKSKNISQFEEDSKLKNPNKSVD